MIDFVLAIDKPVGWTSFDVVKRVRTVLLRRLRHVGVRKLKVGHAGTLDPLASGVMLVCVGAATKRIDTLQAGVKEYVATLSLGATTPSFDLETPIDAHFPTEHITRELIEQTLPRFRGEIEQIPPAYSACKINGDRAYLLARSGETPQLKPKTLTIDEIELLDFSPDKGELTLRVVCSKGTYIRALARDIGQALGSGAHLGALRRTRVGDYAIDQALSVDDATLSLYDRPLEVPSPDEPDNPSKAIAVPPLARTPSPVPSATRSEAQRRGNVLPYSQRQQEAVPPTK